MNLNAITLLRCALRNRVRDEFAFAAYVRDSDRPDADSLAAELDAAALAYLVAGTQRLDAMEAVLIGYADPGLDATRGVVGFEDELTAEGG